MSSLSSLSFFLHITLDSSVFTGVKSTGSTMIFPNSQTKPLSRDNPNGPPVEEFLPHTASRSLTRRTLWPRRRERVPGGPNRWRDQSGRLAGVRPGRSVEVGPGASGTVPLARSGGFRHPVARCNGMDWKRSAGELCSLSYLSPGHPARTQAGPAIAAPK